MVLFQAAGGKGNDLPPPAKESVDINKEKKTLVETQVIQRLALNFTDLPCENSKKWVILRKKSPLNRSPRFLRFP